MRRSGLAGLFACLAALGALVTVGAGAASAAQSCVDLSSGAVAPGVGSPSPGNPCWVEWTPPGAPSGAYAPYPFGYAGQQLETDPNSVGRDPNCTGVGTPGTVPFDDLLYENLERCELQVQTFAFRAWNRGLAVLGYSPQQATFGVPGTGGGALPPNPYVVWLFNGTRWFPNPTFPGAGTCSGDTIIGAGKLDYWLIDAASWGRLCRFDGVNFTWEALPVPAATKATLTNTLAPALRYGACLAWDNCWFFGDGGAEAHWDGQSLTNVPQTGAYKVISWGGAWSGTDAAGNAYAYAVGSSLRPNGAPGPGTFRWNGSTFAPYAGTAPAQPAPGTTNATNRAWRVATRDIPNPAGEGQPPFVLQVLLNWTDGQPPDAPAGNDYEPRPGVFQPEPSVFELVPPVLVPLPPPGGTVYVHGKKKHLKSAIFRVRKPTLRPGPHRTYVMRLRFMVRRKVTIGLEGLRRDNVVARSGVKLLLPGRRELDLRLDRRHWPNRLKWVIPKKR